MIAIGKQIKELRSSQKMTQQDLADCVGVSVGAIYKWEAGLSYPSLDIIILLAKYFDVSVDFLLDFRMQEASLPKAIQEIRERLKNHDESILPACDRYLRNYPNHFELVYLVAEANFVMGIEHNEKEKLEKALTLAQRSLALLHQNKDPDISEMTIYSQIANIYIALEQFDDAIRILKEENLAGLFDVDIGLLLAIHKEKLVESKEYLSRAFLSSVSSIVKWSGALTRVYNLQEKYEEAKEVLAWIIAFLQSLHGDGQSSVFSQIEAFYLVHLAMAHYRLGNAKRAEEILREAKKVLENFRSEEWTQNRKPIFLESEKENDLAMYIHLGKFSSEGIEGAIEEMENADGFREIWAAIRNE